MFNSGVVCYGTMTSQYDGNIVTATGCIYRVQFLDSQVLDFVVEVGMVTVIIGSGKIELSEITLSMWPVTSPESTVPV